MTHISEACDDSNSNVEDVDDVADDESILGSHSESSESENEMALNDEDADPAGIATSSTTVMPVTFNDAEASNTLSFSQIPPYSLNLNGPSDLSMNRKCAPCQPHVKPFPKQKMGKLYRSFHSAFYNKYHWLEYSIEKNSVYCFYCRHFNKRGFDNTTITDCRSFVVDGFRNWKKCYGSLPKK